MEQASPTHQSRGAADNPPNRFERLVLERDEDWNDPDEQPLPTHFYKDQSRSIRSGVRVV